jgi:hypothetical protein
MHVLRVGLSLKNEAATGLQWRLLLLPEFLERFDFSWKNQNRPKLLLSINFAEF